ncbi:tyrosine-type recombinase/integrase [Halopseudomonas sp.]|uniref:tyrosine-type recombinase/integrase n=1 Tax=Halopseudomonas sp. TaxID=2901191 RepID=UPI001A493C99|nr:tyrosine-type recombinase/integrase [Pseudomonas sp.]
MNISLAAFEAPSADELDDWLDQPRLAKCGKLFIPSLPMWRPDKTYTSVNWQAAIACVPFEWQRWLHAALAYRMVELEQSTMFNFASMLSRAAEAGLSPLSENQIIDLRDRFTVGEFSVLVSFMVFWHSCESLERRPDQALIDAYAAMPRKTESRRDVILSLDPEEGPFTSDEQNALHQWSHEAFCHGVLDPERYLYLRLLMVYGQRGFQLRMCVFGDFIRTEQGYKIRLFWAKQRDDAGGFRKKYETFNLDADLYATIEAYQSLVLARLKLEYPDRADWDRAIRNVPLFRRKLASRPNSLNISPLPVIINSNDFNSLEKGPNSDFHAASGSTFGWLAQMEKMDGFPVSSRTHEPLKITRGHRFRHTLGTDLSNAGLDEWSIAHALMHKKTTTVRKYRQVSAELMSLIDAKMSDHLAVVVTAFSGTIVTDRESAKNGFRADRQIQDLAVCGADTACHLDAPLSCYGCRKFQPLLYADHAASLERMERYRAQVIDQDKITGAIWDRAILACRKVILDCRSLISQSETQGDDA